MNRRRADTKHGCEKKDEKLQEYRDEQHKKVQHSHKKDLNQNAWHEQRELGTNTHRETKIRVRMGKRSPKERISMRHQLLWDELSKLQEIHLLSYAVVIRTRMKLTTRSHTVPLTTIRSFMKGCRCTVRSR